MNKLPNPNWTGIVTYMKSPTGDHRYDWVSTNPTAWFALSFILRVLTNTSFDWQVNLSLNEVYVYDVRGP